MIRSLTKRSAWLLVLLALAVPRVTQAKDPVISVEVMEPAKYELPGMKKIAVTPFKGPRGQEVSARLTAKLFEGKQYTLLERDQIDAIMKEHSLGVVEGIVDQAQAAEVGRMAGVDALVFGQVDDCKVVDAQSMTVIKKGIGAEGQPDVFVEAPTTTRTGHISVTFKVVNIQSGQIAAIENVVKEWSGKQINDPRPDVQCALCYLFAKNPMSESITLPSENEVAGQIIDAATLEFVHAISPHTVKVDLFWDKDVGKEGEMVMNYFNSGMTPEAKEAMIALRDKILANPKSEPKHRAAAYYDCGLSHEITGDLEKALVEYKSAVQESIKLGKKPDENHMAAMRRIQGRIEQSKKLQNQTGG